MRLARGVVLTATEDGTVVLDTRRGTYWHLNDSGAQVLRSLLQGEPVELTAAQVAAATGAELETVRSDSEALIADLVAARLLRGRR